ncbi:MAG: ornithine cyclodeaminase [Thermoplasmataceae archaeon]
MLYLTERDVEQNLSISDLIPALKDFISDLGAGKAYSSPRNRIIADSHILNTMPASIPKYNISGLKSYVSSRNGFRAAVLVFRIDPPDLIAVVDAEILGQLRTGALPAMISSMIVKRRSVNFGLFGSGFQSQTQLIGIASVFNVERAYVYSQHPDNSKKFAEKYAGELGIDIKSVDRPEDALRDSDIISTITNSKTPLFAASMLPDHYHLNLAGGNLPNRMEVGKDVLDRSTSIIVEHVDQALMESGEIIGSGIGRDDRRIIDMGSFVSDPSKYEIGGRSVFKSMGIGLEDLCAAYVVLKKLEQI